MCVVSMVGDHYAKKWPEPPWQPGPQIWPVTSPYPIPIGPSPEEFDALKKEVEEMKALLKRAKQYDEDHGQPDCEMDEKVDLLKKVAELVGVDLSEIFGGES